MTEIEEAIKLGYQDPTKQHLFYDLFLNTIFYIPVVEENLEAQTEEGFLPLLVEANEKNYLMLFDTTQKLTDWANKQAKYLPVQGSTITEMSTSDIYWALNYGTESEKFFDPEEIEWLKNIIKKLGEKKKEVDEEKDV